MLKRNPLTEDEHTRVASLMREIDDLSKRGRMYASTGGTDPETLRKAARAYNDRVAVLRVLIGNRPVERLEQKWLYGPVAWSMVVGQEWNAVVRPRERARVGVACNPSTCRNPKHHHAARRNATTPGQGPPKRPRSWPSPKEIVTAELVRLGLSPHRLSVKRVGFSDLARGSRLFVTIHDWKGDPRAQELKEIGRQNGFTVSFLGPGMVGNPSHHHAARKNTDIAGAMIAGASAAIVGKMIRGNPGARKNFRHARIHRLPKPGECEIGLVSQDNCYRKATVDVEMGLKRGTPLRVCQRHADWIKRMKGNPGGSIPSTDLPSQRKVLALAKELRIAIRGFGPGGMLYWDKPGIKRGIPLAQGWRRTLLKLRQIKKDLEREAKRMSLNPASRKRYSPPRDRANMFEVFWMSGKQTWHGGPFFGRPGAEKYVKRYKAGWKGEWPLRHVIMSYKQWGESGAPTSAPEWMRAWQKNPLASGGWKGWSIRKGGNGFSQRFGRGVAHIYINRGARAPNVWTWCIIRNGKRVAGGDVSTDEIARKRVHAALYFKIRKNPDELTGTMIVKCSTCKCVIRTEPCIQEFDGKISHGFCPTHLKEEQEKVKAWIASRKARNNPPSKKEMAAWPKCVTCGKPAGWSVDWLIPSRIPDQRPCCSSECAVLLKKREGKWYGGNPSVSKKIPAYQIRQWVGKFHVGTSNQQVEDALKAQIAKSKDPRWTPATIRQAVAVALKAHNANRTQYRQVMSGRF